MEANTSCSLFFLILVDPLRESGKSNKDTGRLEQLEEHDCDIVELSEEYEEDSDLLLSSIRIEKLISASLIIVNLPFLANTSVSEDLLGIIAHFSIKVIFVFSLSNKSNSSSRENSSNKPSCTESSIMFFVFN